MTYVYLYVKQLTKESSVFNLKSTFIAGYNIEQTQ